MLGELVCWNSSQKISIPEEFRHKVEQVAIGQGHFCIIAEYEGLKCWISGDNGETYLEMDVPEDFWMGTKFVSTGEAHSCAYNIVEVNQALKYILKCFGNDDHRQSTIPGALQTALEAGSAEVTGLASSANNNCAVLHESNPALLMFEVKVVCWGSTEHPINLVPPEMREANDALEFDITLSMGQDTVCAAKHSLALADDPNNTLLCWGKCTGSMCQIPSKFKQSTQTISVGTDHVCAVR